VFRVGGTIALSDELRVRNPFLTIAGQTAPGGGILLRGAGTNAALLAIETHDVIVRYLRLRSGKIGSPGQGQTNLDIAPGATNVIVDHVSISWALDENAQIFKNVFFPEPQNAVPDIDNITVQRSIIAEGLYPHSTGLGVGGETDEHYDAWRDVTNISIHHNLFAHNTQRNPILNCPSCKIINNVIYDWGDCCAQSANNTIDWIGNYFKPGSIAPAGYSPIWQAIPHGTPSILSQDNEMPGFFSTSAADNWQLIRIDELGDEQPSEEYRRFTPLPSGPYPEKVQSAAAAYTSVLANVGANKRLGCKGNWVANRDSVDTRILNNVAQGLPQRPGAESHITDPAQVGGYPTLAAGTACTDSDNDGMPNTWELARGLNPNNAADRNGDDDGDGYTNLEAFLNAIRFKP
jgi:pectate lyase